MSTRFVIDSSALIEYLRMSAIGLKVDDAIGTDGSLHIPDLCGVETVNAFRGLVRGNKTSVRDATALVAELAEFPTQVHSCDLMLDRLWELRANLTAYDATYVALSEVLDATLVTADRRLARGAKSSSRIDVIAVS